MRYRRSRCSSEIQQHRHRPRRHDRPAADSESPDYEAELVFIIGQTAHNVSEADALSYVAGYTCGHDVSARDYQIKRGAGS